MEPQWCGRSWVMSSTPRRIGLANWVSPPMRSRRWGRLLARLSNGPANSRAIKDRTNTTAHLIGDQVIRESLAMDALYGVRYHATPSKVMLDGTRSDSDYRSSPAVFAEHRYEAVSTKRHPASRWQVTGLAL